MELKISVGSKKGKLIARTVNKKHTVQALSVNEWIETGKMVLYLGSVP